MYIVLLIFGFHAIFFLQYSIFILFKTKCDFGLVLWVGHWNQFSRPYCEVDVCIGWAHWQWTIYNNLSENDKMTNMPRKDGAVERG